jgi:hypothetical protein
MTSLLCLGRLDIITLCGDVSDHSSDLMRRAIHSPAGYQALLEGRLSPEPLIKSAAWSFNILPILKRQGFDIADNPAENVARLRRGELGNHSSESSERDRERLALDLALSMDIFSSQPLLLPLSSPDLDELETISLAAEALTLYDEPPPIQFGYLNPVPKGDDNFAFPAGVRLLLKDWIVGANQGTSTYTMVLIEMAEIYPLDLPAVVLQPSVFDNLSSSTPIRFAKRATKELYSSRHVGPSTTQPVITNIERSEPQHVMASTQVLPGVYGARVPLSKKKKGRKRLGGF